jgi:hypothetical protein
LVAVVSLSAWATLIGFTHPQPSAGALILAQPAIKFIVTKSVQMGSDFCHPFGPSLSGFKCSQAGFLGPCPTQSPVTEQARQRTEQTADGSDGR